VIGSHPCINESLAEFPNGSHVSPDASSNTPFPQDGGGGGGDGGDGGGGGGGDGGDGGDGGGAASTGTLTDIAVISRNPMTYKLFLKVVALVALGVDVSVNAVATSFATATSATSTTNRTRNPPLSSDSRRRRFSLVPSS
jgi:hypothetical protein